MPCSHRPLTPPWSRLLWLALALPACGLDPRDLHAYLRDGAVPQDAGATGPNSDAADGRQLGDAAFDAGASAHDGGAGAMGAAGASGNGTAGAAGNGTAGAAGQGGASGVSSPSAMMDAGPDAAVECYDLEVNADWVDDWSNCLEIQGRVWGTTYDGAGGVTGYPFFGDTDPVCVNVAPSYRVPTVLGFNLNQETPAAEPMDYDAKLHGVVGFRVEVSASPLDGIPFPFVGVIDEDADVFCMALPGLGMHEFRFTQLALRCFEMSGGPSPDPEHIRALVFYEPPGWSPDTMASCVGAAALVEPMM